MANIPMKTLRLHGLDDTYTIPTAPEHIGAAPAGYGLGEISVSIKDLNTFVDNGYGFTGNDTSNCPEGMSYSAVHSNKRTDNHIVQTLTGLLTNRGCQMIRNSIDGGVTWVEEWDNPPMKPDVEYRTTERIDGKAVYKKNVNGIIQYRLDGETTWLKYAEAVGGAPSGFGLGTHLATIRRDVNSATASGWHLVEPSATNSPNSTYYAVVRTDSVDGNSVVQTAWLLDSYFSKLVRRKIFGTWGRWEWENPPLIPGVEYCTTERINGKAVYAKAIKTGALTKQEMAVSYSSSTAHPLRVEGRINFSNGTNRVLPCVDASYGIIAATANNNNVWVRGNQDNIINNSEAVVVVYYAKENWMV